MLLLCSTSKLNVKDQLYTAFYVSEYFSSVGSVINTLLSERGFLSSSFLHPLHTCISLVAMTERSSDETSQDL